MTKTVFTLLITLLYFSPGLFAQSTFNKVITFTSNNTGVDFVQAADGGFFVAYQEFNVGDSSGGVLLRLDAAGNEIWKKKYLSSPNSQFAYFDEMEMCPDGNLLVSDVFLRLMKLDTLGNVLWARGLDYPQVNPFEFTSMTVNPQGNIAIAEYEAQTDGRILICDPAGNLLYHQSSDAYGAASDIDPTPDGGYLITGDQTHLVKSDSTGVVEWQVVQTTALPSEFRKSIVLADGSITCLGSTDRNQVSGSMMELTHFSPAGTFIWAARYPFQPGVFGREVVSTNDGGYLLAGAAAGSLLLIKTDASGVPQWSRHASSDAVSNLAEMRPIANGNYALLGQEGISPNVTSRFLKIGSTGYDGCSLESTSVQFLNFSTAQYTVLSPSTTPVSDSLHTVSFASVAPLSVLSNVCIPTHSEGAIIEANAGFQVFPNPSAGPFTIRGDWNDGGATHYVVHDIRGRKLNEYTHFGQNHQFSLDIAVAGLYWVHATHGQHTQIEKVSVSR